MNDGVLVVNFAALQQASGDISKALSTLDSQLQQLERDAGPLVATWDGEAKQAYAERQAVWRSKSEELKAILRDIKLAVDASAADYLNTEKDATRMFRG